MNRRLVGIVLMLVMVAAAACADDAVDRAMRLIGTGKTSEGLALLESAAAGGDREAQYFLGNVYVRPNRIVATPDYAKALQWFRAASVLGLGKGTAALAEMYELGQGVEKSPSESAKLWARAAEQGWDQQALDVRCFQRQVGNEPLSCEPWPDGSGCPLQNEMDELRSAGITGVLRPVGGGSRDRMGPKAHAVIIMDHPPASEVKLKQPRHADIIYVQTADGFDRVPNDVPLLDRSIVLTPQLDKPWNILAGVQDVDGSVTAGGCPLREPAKTLPK